MHEIVTLKLPRDLLSEAQTLAKIRGLTVGEMVRQFLADETDADVPDHPNTRRFRLHRQLGPSFASAKNWDDLAEKLAERGLTLRPQGAGLAIYKDADGKHLCNTATVGFRYRKLVKRFGAPMPLHPHGAKWVTPQEPIASSGEVIEPRA